MGIQKSEIEKYLIIEENAIKTKKECVVELDTEELQVRDEGSHYLSPGFFTIKFIDGFEFLLPFTFKVNVHKSNDIDDETKIIKIKYNEKDYSYDRSPYSRSDNGCSAEGRDECNRYTSSFRRKH